MTGIKLIVLKTLEDSDHSEFGTIRISATIRISSKNRISVIESLSPRI